jgi:hypothetical protein
MLTFFFSKENDLKDLSNPEYELFDQVILLPLKEKQTILNKIIEKLALTNTLQPLV